MSLALPALLGAIGGGPRRLVAPGALDPVLSFARAQVNTRSTALGPDGAGWQEYLADQPRFHGTARRLLVAGQRTNGLRNPRCEGAVAGAPGTLPTQWFGAAVSGITRSVVGTGIDNGIAYVDIRWQGTPASATTTNLLLFEGTTQVAVSPPATWTASVFLRLVGGSLAGLTSAQVNINERDGTGAQLASTGTSFAGVTGAALTGQRFAHTATLNTGTRATPSLTVGLPSAVACDFTLRIGWPQLEQGAFASLPILPPSGSQQASTRGADQASASLAALGIGGGGACTLLLSAMLPQAAPAGAGQTLLQLDDGGNAARFAVENQPAGGSALRIAAGASTAALGSVTPGTPFRIALAIDGAGRIAASLNGAAAIAATGGPASGLGTLRIGAQAGAANTAFGEFTQLSVLPFAVPDAALPSLAATLPL